MNRTLTRRSRAAAIALACAAPLVALAAPATADDAPATGTLVLTVFEDRYPDARLDDSRTTAAGDTDRVRRYGGYVYLQDSAGAWYATGPEDSGEYVFDGVALGDAVVHVAGPDPYESVAFFVADEDGATTMAHGSASFTGGTFLFPGDDRRIPWSGPAQVGGRGTVVVDGASTEALIGMTAVGASAQVLSPDGGTPVTDLAEVTFVANKERIGSTVVADGVTYYPGTRRLVPDGLGIEVAPVAGYAVGQVTARSSISWAPLTVAVEDGVHVVDVTGLATYFDRAEISVQLVRVPTTAAECKDGGWTASVEPAFRNQGECVSYFAAGTAGRG